MDLTLSLSTSFDSADASARQSRLTCLAQDRRGEGRRKNPPCHPETKVEGSEALHSYRIKHSRTLSVCEGSMKVGKGLSQTPLVRDSSPSLRNLHIPLQVSRRFDTVATVFFYPPRVKTRGLVALVPRSLASARDGPE